MLVRFRRIFLLGTALPNLVGKVLNIGPWGLANQVQKASRDTKPRLFYRRHLVTDPPSLAPRQPASGTRRPCPSPDISLTSKLGQSQIELRHQRDYANLVARMVCHDYPQPDRAELVSGQVGGDGFCFLKRGFVVGKFLSLIAAYAVAVLGMEKVASHELKTMKR